MLQVVLTYRKLPIILLILFLVGYHSRLLAQESGDTTQFAYILSMPDAQTSLNYSLISAASRGDTVSIAWLLRNGAEVDVKAADNMTPLIYATANDKLPAARLLLDCGADPNIKSALGETPLIIAAKNDDIELAELLIRDSADVNLKDRFGATAIHYASLYGYYYMTDMLLYYDANISGGSNDGTTPLLAAACAGNADIADLLLQNGAKSNEKDFAGYTPFLVAAQNGDTIMMDLLLRYGADMYASDRYGFDALDLAVKVNSKDAMIYLLRKGNNWKVTQQSHVGAMATATNYRRNELKSLLKYHGLPGNRSHGFDQVVVTTSIKYCFHDFYTGLSVELMEPSYNLGFTGGLDFKPGYTRVLRKEGENLYYQYFDKGSILHAGVLKDFHLTDRVFEGNWILTLSLSEGYSFGNKLKGTDINPGNKLRFMPSTGIKWIKGNFAFSASFDYQKTDFYKIGPVWMRIGLSWLFFTNHDRDPGKIIKWN